MPAMAWPTSLPASRRPWDEADMGGVLVCGVGGITGDAVLSAVVRRGLTARALVHGQSHRQAAVDLGASEVVVADYSDGAAMEAALTGCDAVYFVAPVYQHAEVQWVETALQAAASAGTTRFVYHSVLHSYTPSMPHHRRKAEAEVAVRASGLSWTIVQPAMYAQTVLRIRARSPAGTVLVPYNPDSRFCVIDVEDVAACAAEILATSGHDYAGYELAGPQVETIRRMAEMVNSVTGESRAVRWSQPDAGTLPVAWTAQQRQEYAAMCAEYDAHGLLGSGGVAAWLLGRPATPFADVVQRDLVNIKLQGARS